MTLIEAVESVQIAVERTVHHVVDLAIEKSNSFDLGSKLLYLKDQTHQLNFTSLRKPDWNQIPVYSTSSLDAAAYKIPYLLSRIPIPQEIVTTFILVSVSLFCVYFGTTLSLFKPANANDPDFESPYFHPTDNDHIESHIRNAYDLDRVGNPNPETIDLVLVLLMPVLSMGALWSINYGLKNWPVNDVNWFMNYYVNVISHFSVYLNVQGLLEMGSRKFGWFPRYRLCLAHDADNYPLGRLQKVSEVDLKFASKPDENALLKKWKKYATKLTFWLPNEFKNATTAFNYIFDLRFIIAVPVTYLTKKAFSSLNPYLNSAYEQPETNWLVLNAVSINLAVSGIRQLNVPTFKLAYILLAGLFIYDVTFVFKSLMMVEAATKLNVPIKLLIPRGISDGKIQMSILGLGDIVVPGAFIRLANQYDYFKHYRNGDSFQIGRPVKRTYFITSMIAYTAGLLSTIVAMYTFKAGQPALLYIVPSLLLSNFALSKYLGDSIWLYDGEFKPFSEKDYLDDEDYEEGDEDLKVEEFDIWVDKVELKRDVLEVDDSVIDEDTDLDIVYNWESDEEDDTYVIEVEEASDGSDAEFSEDEGDVNLVEEIKLIIKDRNRTATEWYSDED